MELDRAVDVTLKQRAMVLALLERHLPDTEAWAYGSRVKWTSRPQSDLDLVVFATQEQRRQIDALREAFEESDLPFRVDLLVWDDVPVSFRAQIEAQHATLATRSDGSVGDGWRTRTLGEVATLQRGFDLPTGERKGGPYPVIASTGVVGTHCRAMVSGPGVVVGRSGSLGGGQFIKSDFWPLNTTLWVRDFNANHPRFCYFLLKSLDLERFNAGSGVPTLNRNHIHSLPVRVPPISEQRAIAHILGTLDDKIELNRRLNVTLEAMARALFKSWFVEFDPVRAKMQGRDTGLPQAIADLFPDRLVDSEVGEIPEGWHASTLADVALLNAESWSNRNAPDRIQYVDLSNTKWGYIDRIQDYAWEEAPSRARRVLRRGDTIVGTVRPGNGSFALIDRDGLTGSTGFAVLRPKDSAERELVWCAATSDHSIERLTHLADGGAYPAVRPGAVLDTLVVLPDKRLRRKFSSLAVSLLNRPQENRRDARVLAVLRDTLLPKLVSGEIRVPDAERALESAT